MFYVFLLLVAGLGVAIYLVVILTQVPGAKEERFGVLEALPEELGKWMPDEGSAEAQAAAADGLRRETRTLHETSSGILGGETLIRQARYRSLETNEIVRVEPELKTRRRRVRS